MGASTWCRHEDPPGLWAEERVRTRSRQARPPGWNRGQQPAALTSGPERTRSRQAPPPGWTGGTTQRAHDRGGADPVSTDSTTGMEQWDSNPTHERARGGAEPISNSEAEFRDANPRSCAVGAVSTGSATTADEWRQAWSRRARPPRGSMAGSRWARPPARPEDIAPKTMFHVKLCINEDSHRGRG